jgi:hypothetical protein
MSSNSFGRVAGIAGLLAAVCMIGVTVTSDPETFVPSSPLSAVFLWGGNLTGIVLVLGLYQFYRKDASTLSAVAVAVSLLGYLLFVITTFRPYNPGDILLAVADILVYVVGVPLFSWLAYSTRKLSRPLSIVGMLAGLAGVGVYVLRFGAGVDISDVNHPLIGALVALYFAYLILVLVWLIWTGYSLAFGKAKTAMATA